MKTITEDTRLEVAHYEHLLGEGFKPEHIWSMEKKGVASYSKSKALTEGLRVWENGRYYSSSGLYFPFTHDFGQIRFDEKILRKGKPVKYLNHSGKTSQAYAPHGCKIITEGYKDGAAGSYHGGLPTGCVAGISHVKKALKKDCGYVILFDADGWYNPKVAAGLLRAAIHCNSKIQLVPEIENEPKAGLCEYFKSGKTADDYAELISNAMHPDEFLYEWMKRWPNMQPSLRSRCVPVATLYAQVVGRAA